jgi:copper(I)-binding protein
MRAVIVTIVAIVVTTVASGCQTEDPQAVPGDPQAPFQESLMGTNARVGPIQLIGVHVDAPADVRYRPGDEARLWFTVFNQAPTADVLRSVSSPVAGTTQIRWDADCDGIGTDVAALTLRPVQPNPATAPPGVPPFDAYHVQLIELNREILAGTTIPVTFAFDRAGSVTVEALVQPSNAVRPEPSNRCYASGSAAPSAAIEPSGS